MTSIDCDVLVVGSGAAGATVAARLAELTNLRIVMAEKGPYYDRSFFNQRELDMSVLRAENGRRTTEDGAFPVQSGECVGGGTTVNFALCFDPIPSVWNRWRNERFLDGFSFDANAADYGIPGLNMPAALAEVRRRIDVHEASDDQINDNNRLFAEGAQRLGIEVKRFELNMRGCIGCGFCGQGCAYDAKRATLVTYVPDALARGVRLIHHCDIERIVLSTDGSRAVGAIASVRPTVPGSRPNDADPGPLAIRAKLVVLAAGAVGTPAILQRSNVQDPYDRIGRGVVLHPSLPVGGVFDRPLVNYRNVTGTYYSDAFREEHGIVLDCLFDHPVDTALAVPGVGLEHFAIMRAYRNLAGFGVMLIDDVDDDNRVVWDSSANKPVIRYRLAEGDKRRLRIGARKAVEIMLAAGATSAFLTSNERLPGHGKPAFTQPSQAAACDALEFLPFATLLASAHVQATSKMGASAKTSVTDGRGEVHGMRNLVVCDASSFPTSCGANPMLAIMTLARYQGTRIAGEWRRYAGVA